MDRGAWWATVHRVAKSRKPLKQLSMHTTGMFLSPDLLKGGNMNHSGEVELHANHVPASQLC